MKILLATRNNDKVAIVRRMIERLLPDAYIIPLNGTEIPGDVVEVGTIEDRALQKARYFAAKLAHLARSSEYDAVMAIDDGLAVGTSDAVPFSKEMADRILSGEWPVGEKVFVVRAYALIKGGERPRSELTRVPFVFIGNSAGVKRRAGEYPLSRVLAPEGYTRPVVDMSEDEDNEFNLRYAGEALRRLFS